MDLVTGYNEKGQKIIAIGNDCYLAEEQDLSTTSIPEILENSIRVKSLCIIDGGFGDRIIEDTVLKFYCHVKINNMDINQEVDFFAVDAGLDINDDMNLPRTYLKAKKYAISRLLM
jgi:hypothetical protein